MKLDETKNYLKLVFGDKKVRVVILNGESWLVAKDVADILGFSKTAAMTRSIYSADKGVQIVHTPGGNQKMTVINESGLYTATFHSHKQEAKTFTRWVTHEVLPVIRRNGA